MSNQQALGFGTVLFMPLRSDLIVVIGDESLSVFPNSDLSSL